MARLKGGIFGEISGKLDKLVLRNVKGRTVVSVRPRNYKKSASEKSYKVHAQFTAAVEFSSYINSISGLKQCWSLAFKKCYSAFNEIEKHNIKSISLGVPSISNIITPNKYLSASKLAGKITCGFPNVEFSFNGKSLFVSPGASAITEEDKNSTPASFIFVFSFYNPKEKDIKNFMMDHLIYPLTSIDELKNQIDIPLSESIKKNASLYNKAIVYSAFLEYSDADHIAKFSNTYTKEFNIAE